MSAYMSAVLVCAAVTALCAIMAPDNDSISRYIKYISGLVSLAVLLTPLVGVIQSPVPLPQFNFGTETVGEYDTSIDEAIISEAERSVSKSMRSTLSDYFNINEDDITVDAVLSRDDPADVRLLTATVTLRHRASWTDAGAVESYIKQNYGKDTEVKFIYE